MFDPFPEAVKQFQVHQKRDHSIEIMVVLNDSNASARGQCEEVRRKLRERINGEVPVSLVYGERLGHDGGKLRFISSEVGK